MVSVYANAYLTVADGSTKDPLQGLHTTKKSGSATPPFRLEISVKTLEGAI